MARGGGAPEGGGGEVWPTGGTVHVGAARAERRDTAARKKNDE